MNKAILDIVKPPIIPASIAKNVITLQDAAERDNISYSLPNIIQNGNFIDTNSWQGAGADISAANNIMSCTGNGSMATPQLRSLSVIPNNEGHKIFIRAKVKITNEYCNEFNFQLRGSTSGFNINYTKGSPEKDVLYDMSRIITLTSAAVGDYVRFWIQCGYDSLEEANGKVMQVQDVMCIDLTDIFGTGNEPTKEEMDAIIAFVGAYWSGSRNVLCNPSSKYYWHDFSSNNRHAKLNNFAYTSASGYPTVTVYDTDSNTYTVTDSTSKVGVLTHISASVDTASNKLNLYVNGSLKGAPATIANTIRGFNTISIGTNAAKSAYTEMTLCQSTLSDKAVSGFGIKRFFDNNRRRYRL